MIAGEFPPVDQGLESGPVSLLPHEDLLAHPATTEDVGVEIFGRPPVEELHLRDLIDDEDDEPPPRPPAPGPPRAQAPPEAILEFARDDDDDDEEAEEAPLSAIIDDEDDSDEQELSRFDLDPESLAGSRQGSRLALPADAEEDVDWIAEVEEDGPDPLEEDEAAAEFTLSRNAPETVEELDLAAMVDVAFQLVLFFLVTATTVLYKTLDVPKPNPDAPPGAVSQGQGKSLDDLARDYILVEIDPQGTVKVDHEPAPSDMAGLAERLRQVRTASGRTKMLLSADAATLHKSAVAAYDAANEIGLGIAIARPTNAGTGGGGPAPTEPEAKKAAPG